MWYDKKLDEVCKWKGKWLRPPLYNHSAYFQFIFEAFLFLLYSISFIVYYSLTSSILCLLCMYPVTFRWLLLQCTQQYIHDTEIHFCWTVPGCRFVYQSFSNNLIKHNFIKEYGLCEPNDLYNNKRGKGPQRNSTEPALVNIQQCKYQKQMTYNEHLGIYLLIWRPPWKSSVLPSW